MRRQGVAALVLAYASTAYAEPSLSPDPETYWKPAMGVRVADVRATSWLAYGALQRPALRALLLQGVGQTSLGVTSGGGGGGSAFAGGTFTGAPLGSAGVSLGSSTAPFQYLFLYGDGTFGSTSLKLTGAPTGNRVVSLQDATQTLAQLGAQTFTGIQRFIDGAAATPGITGTTGTTTGIWFRAGTTIDFSISGAHKAELFLNSGTAFNLESAGQFTIASGVPNATGGTGWSRAAAGIWRSTTGDPSSVASALGPTVGTATQSNFGEMRSATSAYSWTNAMVVALGATTTGNISMFTLKAKQVVENAYVVITGAAAGPTTVTVSCGRTSAAYIDYIVASDAKAAANTIYGDASAERGTNLTGYDLPSYTGTTTVNCQFVSSGGNLSTVTGSTGMLIVSLTTLP